ncbi:MAG: hypothetical protein HQK62_01420 [Desulfamplus sp.]|nr:hypothetical protein [Desulfamplus sp.]
MKSLSESKIFIVDDTETYIDLLVEALEGFYDIMLAINGVNHLNIIAPLTLSTLIQKDK